MCLKTSSQTELIIRVCAGNERKHNTSIDPSSLRKCSKSTRLKLAQRSHPDTRTALKTLTTPCTSPCTASTLHILETGCWEVRHLAPNLWQEPFGLKDPKESEKTTKEIKRILNAKESNPKSKKDKKDLCNPQPLKAWPTSESCKVQLCFASLKTTRQDAQDATRHSKTWRKIKGKQCHLQPRNIIPVASSLQIKRHWDSQSLADMDCHWERNSMGSTRGQLDPIGSLCHERRPCVGSVSSEKQRHKWLCMFPWVHCPRPCHCCQIWPGHPVQFL